MTGGAARRDTPPMDTLKSKGHLAGALYFAMAILTGGGYFLKNRIVDAADASGTLARLLRDRAGALGSVAANLAGQTVFLFLGLALFDLFSAFDRKGARMLLAIIVASVPVSMLVQLGTVGALLLAEGGRPASAVALCLRLFEYGDLMSFIFWGLWLFPLGLLIWKSRYLPRLIGLALMAGCFGYLVKALGGFFWPSRQDIAALILVLTNVGEVSCVLWMLVFGARDRAGAKGSAALPEGA
jgi:hypothetical protein